MSTENIKYYKVVAKCGHVGKNKYIPISFPVIAESGKKAAKIARNFPRVKHNHKDAILKCEKISYEEYVELRAINDNDPYLLCKSRHEQTNICDLSNRLVDDHHCFSPVYCKQDRKSRIQYKLAKYQEILESMIGDDIYDYIY